MKYYLSSVLAVILTFSTSFLCDIKAQDQKPFDVTLMAEEEANRLQKLLDLDDWQVFYVDSTLKVGYLKLQADLESLKKSKVSNVSIYQEVRDVCADNIDASYKKIFNEDQWAAYLKSGAAKQQKQRAKRREKK